MTPFLFFTFCSHLMTPIFKMLSHLMTPFFRNVYLIWASCSHLIMTPFSPINDHLVICTQSLKEGFFALRLTASRNDPSFFLYTEVFTKRPPSFYSPHQMTPYCSFVLTERPPFFSLFSLSPKDPYFRGRVRTSPSLPYVSAPLPGQIRCLFRISGLPWMAPFLFENWFRYRSWTQNA